MSICDKANEYLKYQADDEAADIRSLLADNERMRGALEAIAAAQYNAGNWEWTPNMYQCVARANKALEGGE